MQSRAYRVVRLRMLLAPAALAFALALSVLPAPHAQADAPPCRYTTTADTVLDRDTGLTWQRAVDASTYAWSNAIAYCDNLTLAGQTDWRLPTIHELQTIVDESRVQPAIDINAFSNTPSAYFWSSSPFAGDSSDAWYVSFSSGGVSSVAVGDTSRVRCVR